MACTTRSYGISAVNGGFNGALNGACNAFISFLLRKLEDWWKGRGSGGVGNDDDDGGRGGELNRRKFSELERKIEELQSIVVQRIGRDTQLLQSRTGVPALQIETDPGSRSAGNPRTTPRGLFGESSDFPEDIMADLRKKILSATCIEDGVQAQENQSPVIEEIKDEGHTAFTSHDEPQENQSPMIEEDHTAIISHSELQSLGKCGFHSEIPTEDKEFELKQHVKPSRDVLKLKFSPPAKNYIDSSTCASVFHSGAAVRKVKRGLYIPELLMPKQSPAF